MKIETWNFQKIGNKVEPLLKINKGYRCVNKENMPDKCQANARKSLFKDLE